MHPTLTFSLACLALAAAADAQTASWTRIPAASHPVFPADLPSHLRAYASDQAGNVFMASPTGVFRYASGQTRGISPALDAGQSIHQLVADPVGIPWILIGDGQRWDPLPPDPHWKIKRHRGGAWETVDFSRCGSGDHLNLLGVDAQGRLIFSVSSGGGELGPGPQKTFRLSGEACQEIPVPARNDGQLTVGGYTRDGAGTEYFFGSRLAGDIVLGDFILEVARETRFILSERPLSELVGMKGQVLASLGGSLGAFRDGKLETLPVQGRIFRDVSFLFQDSRQDIWIPHSYWDGTGRKSRMLHLSGKDTAFIELTLPYDAEIGGVSEDGDGNLWFEASNGDLVLYTRPGKARPLAVSPHPGRRSRAGYPGAPRPSRDVLGRLAGKVISGAGPWR